MSLPTASSSAPVGQNGLGKTCSGQPELPPPCIQCGKPVQKRDPRLLETGLGRRIIDGVEWCWMCSRSCTGKRQGARAVKEQRCAKWAQALADGRARRAKADRLKSYEEDVKTLRRYGVPQMLAEELLDRLYKRAYFLGYSKNYKHHVGRCSKKKKKAA
jgi:hypothetical protein